MSNYYGFAEDQTKSTFNPFPVGEGVEDVEITGAKYTSAENGSWEAIDISYTRAGTTLNDKMFAVKREGIKPRSFIPDDTEEDAYEDQIRTYNTQLLHIATKLDLTREDLAGCNATKGFARFASDYCEMINKHLNGQKLYLKTTKDKNGYPKVCRNTYNTTPFVQRMDSGPCELKYTEKELVTLEDNKAPKNGVVDSQKSSGVTSKWTSKSV